ncbi:MAG: glutamine-hydrolyzing carbamoyl-phosphate synthase small subunit [Psychroflexus sp.]|nr:glutamine-hydrolyzing carbamoyl-phosphate synthase small subunit [Psychroflexus sp.]MDN6309568.1 glutamine-hydrolyzing carbamoyl-phosphate synthase small subunit [Psychroflexus sp.]
MKYNQTENAVVLLQDGTIFHGKAVGQLNYVVGEICFNTGMTGYQEVFTDPSYFGQIMVTTNTHIGNYGTNKADMESSKIQISGLVCKNFSLNPSRVDSDSSLLEFMDQHQLNAVSDIDTRALVRHIRKNGAMNAVIGKASLGMDVLKEKLAAHPSMKGLELASQVSTKEIYEVSPEEPKYRVAVLDLGVKHGILRDLKNRECQLTVFPYDTSLDTLKTYDFDGLFISNGPGDPEPLKSAVEIVKHYLDVGLPYFGICLGHQVFAQALGIPTFKMHNGHRGINHPVQNLLTGKDEVTSQNHGFAVDREAAEQHPDVAVSHIHLNDHTLAGLRHKTKPAFSVQHHPEGSPGPNDALYLFDDFIELMKNP